MKKNRRLFFKLALASAVAIMAIAVLLTTPAAMSAEKSSLKIGSIGSGNIVGPLTSAKQFDQGGPLYGKAVSARELREMISSHPVSKP